MTQPTVQRNPTRGSAKSPRDHTMLTEGPRDTQALVEMLSTAVQPYEKFTF